MESQQEKLDKLNIQLAFQKAQDRLVNTAIPSDDEGFKTVERLREILEHVSPAIAHPDASRTSLEVFLRLKSALEEVRQELDGWGNGRVNYDVVEEAGDRILAVLPLIDYVPRGSESSARKMLSAQESLNSFHAFIDDLKKAATAHAESAKQSSAKLVKDSEAAVADAIKLSEFITAKTLSTDYAKRAEDEKELARQWTLWVWGSSAVTVIFLIVVLIYQLSVGAEQSTNWPLVSTKILLFASLGLATKWMSRRAGRHLQEESRYHRLAVNFNAVSPFLASLEKDLQDRTKAEIALRNFTEPQLSESSADFETSSTLEFLKAGVEKVRS